MSDQEDPPNDAKSPDSQEGKPTRVRRRGGPRTDKAKAGGARAEPKAAKDAQADRKPRKGNRGKGEGPRGPNRPNTSTNAPLPKPRLNTFDASGDFAAMLEESGGLDDKNRGVAPGDRVEATLVHVGKENAVFNLGAGEDAWMPSVELPEGAEIGQSIKLTVLRTGDSVLLGRGSAADPAFVDEAIAAGLPVEGKVTGHNKGGLEIALQGGLRAFCPISQVDLRYVEQPETYVGRSLQFLVTQRKGKELVVSRRALLERERAELAEQTLADLHVGKRIIAEVGRIEPFGAFIDLGGVDGLLPTSEMGWGVRDPKSAVTPGQRVEVEVIRLEETESKLKITLSRRALMDDPMESGELVAGSTREGRVTRLEDFGAFVEVGDGIEGLVHISEMSHARVRHPSDVVQVGDAVTVRVLDVDLERRRVGLSLKDPSDGARGGQTHLKSGQKVVGVVSRHERYGVFVELKDLDDARALLPASETGTERGADLRRAFPLGTELDLAVIEVDDKGRVRVSKIARERLEEREVVEAHNQQSGPGGGLGTFADLLKNVDLKS